MPPILRSQGSLRPQAPASSPRRGPRATARSGGAARTSGVPPTPIDVAPAPPARNPTGSRPRSPVQPVGSTTCRLNHWPAPAHQPAMEPLHGARQGHLVSFGIARNPTGTKPSSITPRPVSLGAGGRCGRSSARWPVRSLRPVAPVREASRDATRAHPATLLQPVALAFQPK